MSAPPLGWSHAYLPHQKEIYVPCGMKFLQEFQDLKTKNIHSSRIRIITSWTSNFLPSLAPQARTQARQPPTNLLITIWTEQIFGAWKVFWWILTKITNYSIVLLIGWCVFTVQKWLPSMWSKSALIRVLPTTKSNRDQHENAVYFLKFQLYFAGFQFHYKRTNSA